MDAESAHAITKARQRGGNLCESGGELRVARAFKVGVIHQSGGGFHMRLVLRAGRQLGSECELGPCHIDELETIPQPRCAETELDPWPGLVVMSLDPERHQAVVAR